MNALIILDGFGQASETYGNAIAQAKKPFYDSLIQKYPHTLINASGYAVGGQGRVSGHHHYRRRDKERVFQ